MIRQLRSLPEWIVLTILLGVLNGCNGESTQSPAAKLSCETGEAVATDGYRRLALIVGVGEYADESVQDLAGTVVDARRMHELLTGQFGYGFPEQNVCLLLDEEATGENFRRAFDEVLVNRARPDDIAVVFFAGHGSQVWDANGDEPDQWDETLVFHDALVSETGEIVDDDFHDMLRRLHERTQNIVTILDSCNSGTATRAASSMTARFLPPTDRKIKITSADGDGEGAWAPQSLPGLIAFTAATDGTPALERNAKGIFTDALIQVLSQVSERPLTYAQVARQVPPLVASSSYQIPFFQGELNQSVFGNSGRTRPVGWDVVSVGPPIELSGPPLPGFGVGAELRVYDGAASGSDVKDPGKAKATIIIDEATGVNAAAHVTALVEGGSISPGDLAILVRPANDFLKIALSIRPASLPGGVPEDRAEQIRTWLADEPEAAMLVEVTESLDDFELSVGSDGKLILRGPENQVRMVFDRDRAVVRNLWQHARQHALLKLRGEGGADFVDQETLEVQLIPAARQADCADGTWQQSSPNQEQVIPLCHTFNIKVSHAAGSPVPLLIGGFVLSTDGSTYGFPADGRAIVLQPGDEEVLKGRSETFRGTVPIDVQDHVLVFGTQETNPVQWHLLTETAATRSAAAEPRSGLYGALHRYLQPNRSRGIVVDSEDVENTTWTMSALTMRVEANDRFERPQNVEDPPQPREYSLANFDIRPYLPLDHRTALFKVLNKADELARSSVTDGYSYKQHDWSRPTPEENLAIGIDCSRAIWYVFDDTELPYNDGNRYIPTANMVGPSSIMSHEFEQCPLREDFRLGDVLVYRSDTKNDGHVVMVIDPRKRIAWGSHGWDGNAKESDYVVQPDTGVEYQLIKYKQDWARWDRTDMELKACWRYRRFSQEADAGIGVAGFNGRDPCDQSTCRL